MEIEKLEELLLSISYQKENRKEAEKAFTELYKEFSKFLTGFVKKHTSDIGIKDQEFRDAVVNNVFMTIYENPLKYTTPNDENKNSDLSFKLWMTTIAKNEIYDLIREFKILELSNPDNTIEPAFDETYIDFEKEKIDYDNLNAKIMEDALNSLPERDRDIMRFLYLYHEEGKHTPSKVLNDLCILHGTTKDNIRQIKIRSEKKIIQFFSKYSQLKPIKYAKG